MPRELLTLLSSCQDLFYETGCVTAAPGEAGNNTGEWQTSRPPNMGINHQSLTCHSKKKGRFAFNNHTHGLPAKPHCPGPAFKTRQAGREPTVGTQSLCSVLCLDRVLKTLQNNAGSHFLRFPPNCVASEVPVCLLSVHLLLGKKYTRAQGWGIEYCSYYFNIAGFYLKYWPQTHCTTCCTSSYILPGPVCTAKQKSTQSLAACRYCVKSRNQGIRRLKKKWKEEKNLM